jgi:hypothetical protein
MTRIHFAGENLSETKNRLAIALGLTGDDSQFPETAAHAKKRGWSASSLEEADLVVYGLRHRPGPECEEVSKKARARDLPCIFFSSER